MFTLLSTVALALPPVDQTVCVFHKPDLDDVSSAVGDDYIVNNNNRPAAFARVALLKIGGPTVYQWTDEDGCTLFEDVDPDDTYKVRLYGLHDIDSMYNTLQILDEEGGEPLYATTNPWSPPISSTTTNIAFDASASGQKWINLAAVASWVILRRPDAFEIHTPVDDAVYTIILAPPPSPYQDLVGIYWPEHLATYINPDDRGGFASKYIIAHEFAHQLQHWVSWYRLYLAYPTVTGANEGIYAQDGDYGATDDCLNEDPDSHYMASKEFQSAAINEGMADWVAAVAFNNTAHSDCRLKPYGDFPWLDGDTPSPEEFSCQGWDDVGNTGDNGGIEWIDYSIDAFDYLGDYCNTGTMTDRGTELDWLRFFWDLDRESTGGEGMSFYTMVDLYGDALPYAWSSSDAHDDLESVYATTYSSEWDDQETLNGVHR